MDSPFESKGQRDHKVLTDWVESQVEAQQQADITRNLGMDHIDGKHQEKANPECILCWPRIEDQTKYWEEKDENTDTDRN